MFGNDFDFRETVGNERIIVRTMRVGDLRKDTNRYMTTVNPDPRSPAVAASEVYTSRDAARLGHARIARNVERHPDRYTLDRTKLLINSRLLFLENF